MSQTAVQQQQQAEPFKDGQRKPTPPPAEATRVFYESLYKQKPESKMALMWCVQYGVLEGDDLKKALKKVDKMSD